MHDTTAIAHGLELNKPNCTDREPRLSNHQDIAPKPVLIILHQEHSTPGHVGLTLQRQGHSLDIRKPRFGDPLPDTLSGHAGAVIFGGPMSANDDDDFIKLETDWIALPLKENKPFLGICLGAQMLARHLGTRVYRDPQQRVEIGYHAIQPLAPDAAGVPWPVCVYQWHKEGFDLPAGATLLARSDSPFEAQAFAYGSALSIQFHPEITYAQVNRWSGKNAEKLKQSGAQPRPQQLRDHIARAPGIHRWLDAALKEWKRVTVA